MKKKSPDFKKATDIAFDYWKMIEERKSLAIAQENEELVFNDLKKKYSLGDADVGGNRDSLLRSMRHAIAQAFMDEIK